VKRFPLALSVLLAAFVALAGPASAHVTVSAPDATRGGEAVLTFRVPTESDTASTTRLAVQLPADTPFASVSVLPQPGWTFTTRTVTLPKPITNDDGDKITEAISEIDWTASDASSAIKPGEFGEFTIEAGPLPDTPEIAFGAVQTYSDGSVVRWNEQAAPGSKTEPDHPKPALTLAAADPQAATPAAASTTGATVLAIVALVVAALALGVAVVTNARRRSE
jgi:uncharacterized protein